MDSASFIIAIVSLSVAMLTAGWTIYRDAVRRPRFRVSIAIKSVVQAGRDQVGPDIYVEALNLGPLPNRLGIVFCRKSWWQRRRHPTTSIAFITPDYEHVATTRSGERIEVGDIGTHVFPYDADCFLKEDWTQIGVGDGYGRMHWAPRKQVREVHEKYRQKFLDATLPSAPR